MEESFSRPWSHRPTVSIQSCARSVSQSVSQSVTISDPLLPGCALPYLVSWLAGWLTVLVDLAADRSIGETTTVRLRLVSLSIVDASSETFHKNRPCVVSAAG